MESGHWWSGCDRLNVELCHDSCVRLNCGHLGSLQAHGLKLGRILDHIQQDTAQILGVSQLEKSPTIPSRTSSFIPPWLAVITGTPAIWASFAAPHHGWASW
jgi:hypothetical protein